MIRPKGRARVRILAALLLAAALPLAGCANGASVGGTAANGKQLLTIPREDMATFTRNFNPFSPNAAPMTQQAIYEPMLVFDPANNTTTPWLATKWTVAKDGTNLTFTLRNGVQWSDGEPFTAKDVAYTFGLQKKVAGGYDYLDTVKATDDHTVVFDLNRPFSPALYELGQQVIVPEHVWAKIADPAKDTNGTPVGTGPYTEVSKFQSQSYDLLRNPHYWQPGKQKIEGIRMLAFAGNDPANLATTNGETDWADQFIPDIQKTFVAKDPAHRHYWFPPIDAMINWQLNTAKAPFNDVSVRKALSMAIDRDAITKVAMQGYTHPADCTGLSDAYEQSRSASVAQSCDWTTHDVAAANALLDKAGYPKGKGGVRTKPDGSRFSFDISVGGASSDWLSVANIIAQNLKDVGVEAKVKSPDWSAVVASYEDGSFDSGIVWSNNAPTPYQFYSGVMSTKTVVPVGQKATQNYNRFGSPQADRLLDEFAASADHTAQAKAVDQLQQLFDDDAPVIPLFPGPRWGAYNTTRFTGFPDEHNPYATLSTRTSTAVLVLTTLEPVVSK
jgi:peptide/nickel transport system substrate-binding protein